MIYIRKKTPPGEMTRKVSEIKSSPEWKSIGDGDTETIRNAFDQLPKDVIRKSLLEEQHYLCAYCMRRIYNNGRQTAIEHWYPLSKDKKRALDYKNMLAVCDGGKGKNSNGKKILCCDACKGDEDKLSISPLHNQQMNKIAYNKDGFIKTDPYDEGMENDIRDVLRLNGLWKNGKFIADTATELVKGRRDAYSSYESYIKRLDRNGNCTSAMIKKKIEKIKNNEKRIEFAGVYLYFFNKKYQSLVKRGL